MTQEILYKYRGLSNLKRFLEIILNKKFYGALYTELNDPMEGKFRYNYKIPHGIIEALKDQKQKTYICSLPKRNDIGIITIGSHVIIGSGTQIITTSHNIDSPD